MPPTRIFSTASLELNPLDTTRVYETPEGVRLEMKVAGPVVRACAWAIDLVIRGGLYLGIAILFAFFGGLGTAVTLIGFFLIEWFYPVIFEVQSGATPGKKAMGIWVINDNGTPISWSASILRNLLRAVDFLPLLYGLGLTSMLLQREGKRLGDLAAGSLVVYRDVPPKRPKAMDIAPQPPPAGLGIEEQLALLEFTERRDLLSSERRVELAEILRDLTGREGQPGVDQLDAYAGWLTRGR